MDIGPIYKSINDSIDLRVISAWDDAMWALTELNVNLYDNQIEIVEAVTDINVKELAILQARGAGKTFSVGVGLVKLCLDIPELNIGVFGPKAEQANRIIKCIADEIVRPSSPVYSRIDWSDSTNSRLKFMNGSEILAISAAETTMQEGWHFNIVVLDECHRISDISTNQRILPMLGSLAIGKIIKIGIPMYRNNFFQSCQDPNTRYKVLCRDWTQCPILLTNGSIFYNEKEYSMGVLALMPLSMKKEMFPDRPDLHWPSTMSEVDFKIQYGMEWVSDINLVLNTADQKMLVSGIHNILKKDRSEAQESYYFGLDTAGGSPVPGKTGLDSTALAIWRLLPDGRKEKVACYAWQGSILTQMQEIRSIIDPKGGIFPCKFGLVDYSNIGINLVESFKQDGIPVEGILFSNREETSKKNFKNAMYDRFVFELQAGRIRYPSFEEVEHNPAMKTAFDEWCTVERRRTLGINDQIEAPSGCHDDHPSSDVLAVWAMDKGADLGIIPQPLPMLRQLEKMPSLAIPFFPAAGTQIQRNRYLDYGYNPTQRTSQPSPYEKPSN